ncbi:MAG TPA: ABC transporter permease [Burkholderiales bacterium]|jgi:putative spermidine/putrescine transport system permease protein|nr:ABC transporter permease [Burkholderiales bacterium]
MKREVGRLALLLAPAAIVFCAFWLLPMARIAVLGAEGPHGLAAYSAIITDARYFNALVSTVTLSVVVTVATVIISGIAGLFLARNHFPGRALLTAMLTLPLAFPGVVVGFMVIMLGGRQGLIANLAHQLFDVRAVFAYSIAGLFAGYLYFSIPRVILTMIAAMEKLDPALEEAARSLGAGPWRVLIDVVIPALKPAVISSSAICFATSMGAFGTAFTLATRINVLSLVIYTDFTYGADFVMAAAMSIVLGAITWLVLALARTLAGSTVAAAGG